MICKDQKRALVFNHTILIPMKNRNIIKFPTETRRLMVATEREIKKMILRLNLGNDENIEYILVDAINTFEAYKISLNTTSLSHLNDYKCNKSIGEIDNIFLKKQI